MQKVSPSLVAALLLLLTVQLSAARQQKQVSAGKDGPGFQSKCGTAPEVAAKLGNCMEPIMQIMRGEIGMPTSDEDLKATCVRFETAEKCIRTTSKDCLVSIHRAAASTIAGAIRKFRVVECKSAESRAKYTDAEKCCIKKGRELDVILRNHTAITQAIRDEPGVGPEEKIFKFCCLLDSMYKEIDKSLNPVCAKEVPVILGILHALTDDARSTFCVRPKCQNAFRGLLPARLKSQQTFLEPLSEILFMLKIED